MNPPRLESLPSPAAWLGDDLARSGDWFHVLTQAERDDLSTALTHAKATGKSMLELERADFPLRVLAPAIAKWLDQLQNGRGFLNVRGIPFRADDEAAWIHWGLGLHLGTAVSQNAAGDLLGHVRDTGADPDDPSVRLYKTRVEMGFHSDAEEIRAPERSGAQ